MNFFSRSLHSSALKRYMIFSLTSFSRSKVLNYTFFHKPFIQIICSYDPRHITSDLNFSGAKNWDSFFSAPIRKCVKLYEESVLMLDIWRHLLIFTRRYLLLLKLIINYVLHFLVIVFVVVVGAHSPSNGILHTLLNEYSIFSRW